MAGEVRKVCEQKCYFTVGFQGVYGSPWPSSTTGDKSFLVLSRVLALHEVCVWPGDGEWGSEILMENKKEHHVPSVLTHSVLLRNKHRRNRSQQEDTTELPISTSLTIMHALRLLALWRGQTTEPRNRTPRERIPLWPHPPLF